MTRSGPVGAVLIIVDGHIMGAERREEQTIGLVPSNLSPRWQCHFCCPSISPDPGDYSNVRSQVHGTCLGFEALAVVVSDNATILGK